MPKKRSAEAVTAEEYESDGGFVEDAPKSKRSKVSKAKVQEKDSGNGGTKGMGKDGEVFWEVCVVCIRDEGRKKGDGKGVRWGTLANAVRMWCSYPASEE